MRNQNGFTLIEVVIATAVCVVCLGSILAANSFIHRVNNSANERVIAMQDAHQVFERIRNTANSGIFPGNVIAAYPSGQNIAGFTRLTNEQVSVSYVSTTADPLDMTVTVSWLQNGTRPVSIDLSGLMTQRQ